MFRVIVVLVTAISTCAVGAGACSVQGCLNRGDEYLSNFTVHVEHDGKPLEGVTVEVRPFNSDSITAIKTGQDGNAAYHVLVPGDYWITTSYLGIGAGSGCFHVLDHPTEAAKKTINYDWGDLAPSTKRLAGRFVDIQFGRTGNLIERIKSKHPVPVVGAKMKLQGAVNGFIREITTDSDGHFDFPDAPEGTYVLHVEGGKAEGREFQFSDDLLLSFGAGGKFSSMLILQDQSGGGSCGGMTLKDEAEP